MTQHSVSLFQGLPYDIHFEIGKQLGYSGILRLAATNRHFHKILNPKIILGPEQALEFVTERDGHLRKIGHELFACSNCLRLLPRKKFVRAASFYDISWSARFCLDCTAALKSQRHLKAVTRADGKLRYYFCHNCGDYRTVSERCHGKRINSDTTKADAVEAMSLCTQPRRQRQGIENLPAHILAKISSFLGFKDVLYLAQVSRGLNDVVNPNQWVPLHARYRYVHDKWTNDIMGKHFDTIPTFPCYICCRIYPKKKFTDQQIRMAAGAPETGWKMRCLKCVWLMGLSPKSVTRIEHRRREMCDICKCVKYARQTCGRCQELYIQRMIDRKTLHPPVVEMEDILPLMEDLFTKDE